MTDTEFVKIAYCKRIHAELRGHIIGSIFVGPVDEDSFVVHIDSPWNFHYEKKYSGLLKHVLNNDQAYKVARNVMHDYSLTINERYFI